jgi:hypothetical protein
MTTNQKEKKMEFTIELYKSDKRRKDGKRLLERVEIIADNINDANEVAIELVKKDPKFSFELHKSYNDVRNLLSGKIVKEHYLTPYCCSVGSETYFSM